MHFIYRVKGRLSPPDCRASVRASALCQRTRVQRQTRSARSNIHNTTFYWVNKHLMAAAGTTASIKADVVV